MKSRAVELPHNGVRLSYHVIMALQQADSVATTLDVRPRLLVHHVLGDFVVDPWADGKLDLSKYGIQDYEVVFGAPEIAPGRDVQSTIVNALLIGGAVFLVVAAMRGTR